MNIYIYTLQALLCTVQTMSWGLGTDLWIYEPAANATIWVVWRLEWNGMEKCHELRRVTFRDSRESSRLSWKVLALIV